MGRGAWSGFHPGAESGVTPAMTRAVDLMWCAVGGVPTGSFSEGESCGPCQGSGAMSTREAEFTPGFERRVNFGKCIGGECSAILPKGKKKDGIHVWAGCTFIRVVLCRVDVSVTWCCLWEGDLAVADTNANIRNFWLSNLLLGICSRGVLRHASEGVYCIIVHNGEKQKWPNFPSISDSRVN